MTEERTRTERAAHAQVKHQIRLEWGPRATESVTAGADVAVVVDTLSFTTTLSIAVARGTRVHPFPWKDDRAVAYAAERDAVLAVGRLEARHVPKPPPSLSPSLLLASEPVKRLVLPSPNGSTICSVLAELSPRPDVIGACLRNASAVTKWLESRAAAGRTIAFIPAGERWPDGSLRPSLEDLWGAGAVISGLIDVLPNSSSVSSEAINAAVSFQHVASRLPDALIGCASGQELVGMGFTNDVAAAAALDADNVVPVLSDNGFVPAA